MWGSYSGVQGVLHCLDERKGSLFDAAILIFSPLAGLRPSRSGEALTLNKSSQRNFVVAHRSADDAFQQALQNRLGLRFNMS
jgi:hypothetical protein